MSECATTGASLMVAATALLEGVTLPERGVYYAAKRDGVTRVVGDMHKEAGAATLDALRLMNAHAAAPGLRVDVMALTLASPGKPTPVLRFGARRVEDGSRWAWSLLEEGS